MSFLLCIQRYIPTSLHTHFIILLASTSRWVCGEYMCVLFACVITAEKSTLSRELETVFLQLKSSLILEQILLPKALPESALHNSRQHLLANNYIFSRCSESLEKSLLDVYPSNAASSDLKESSESQFFIILHLSIIF